MAEADSIQRAVDRWRAEGIQLLPPETEQKILEVFAQIERPVSRDIVELYRATGGFPDYMDSHLLSVWSLDRLRNEHDKCDRPYTLFADFLISSHAYCFRYCNAQSSSVHVYHFDGREPALVANSVSEFLDLYLSDPEKLLSLNVQLVFICALSQEAKCLRKLSIIKRRQARLIVCGVGPKNAERATRKLLNDSKPTLIISTGVAGALSAAMKVGDIIVANEIIEATSGERFSCMLPSSILHPPSSILSVSRMITSVEEKKSLGRKFNAVAVDMESAAIARVCSEHGVPFATIRAISDTADDVLPEAVTRFFDAEGRVRPGRVIAEIGRDLSLLKVLKRLQRQTAVACESLCVFLAKHPF